ncbi:hypothetical protein ACFQZX_16550 [Mucilaginibacter litoreus]|uniref:Fimbrillin-A associated anchor protein Mfa1 and Mfa2 n=1 Tax=Mucilaginibacter litoreus TaxID=1048221 RepID=A0ABW3AWB5_9SPHI
MKAYKFIAVFGLILFSCTKSHNPLPDDEPSDNTKTFGVTFNVLQESESTKSLNSNLKTNSNTSITGFTDHLVYQVYDSAGKLITTLKQDSASSNYGRISDTFAPGKYNIVIIAAKGGVIKASEGYFYPNGYDSFFKQIPITVTDHAINKDIVLERVVGKLQLKILDAIPTTVASLKMEVVGDVSFSLPAGGINQKSNTLTITKSIPDSLKGNQNVTITTYIANTFEPFKVNIYAYDASGKTLHYAVVNDVSCQKNTVTLLSGKLFENAQTGIHITFPEWGTDPNVIHF